MWKIKGMEYLDAPDPIEAAKMALSDLSLAQIRQYAKSDDPAYINRYTEGFIIGTLNIALHVWDTFNVQGVYNETTKEQGTAILET